VLGFGTLKGDPDTPSDYSLVTFWTEAVKRLQRHGLTPAQRRSLAASMVAKGAPLPPLKACREREAREQKDARNPRPGLLGIEKTRNYHRQRAAALGEIIRWHRDRAFRRHASAEPAA
jgi:hypothetical protein